MLEIIRKNDCVDIAELSKRFEVSHDAPQTARCGGHRSEAGAVSMQRYGLRIPGKLLNFRLHKQCFYQQLI